MSQPNYLKAFVIYIVVALVGSMVAGAIGGFIIGFVMALVGSPESAALGGSIVGGIAGIVVSYLAFKWVIQKFILADLEA